MNANSRAYGAAHFALELDDTPDIGLFRSIEGGDLTVEPINVAYGGHRGRFVQNGKPKYDDLRLSVGMAMSQPFFAWVADFFRGKAGPRSGAVIAADFHYQERARRTFAGALIREVAMPKLSAADSQPAYLQVSLAVESTALASPKAGAKLTPPRATDRQRMWASNRFQLTLDGYESGCGRVTSVEGFAVKQSITEQHEGGALAPRKFPGIMEYPKLAFKVPAADAAPFAKRLQHLATKAAAHEPRGAGSLTCLDDSNNTLLTITLLGVEINKVTYDKHDASSDAVSEARIELSVESMTFAAST